MPRQPLWLLMPLVTIALSCEANDDLGALRSAPVASSAPQTPTSLPSTASRGQAESKAPPGKQPRRAADRPVMIAFTRDYCLPCQVMKPWVATLRREHAHTIDVVAINLDRKKNERFAPFLGTRVVPTQIFVGSNGHIEARHEGVSTVEAMTATFRRLRWID